MARRWRARPRLRHAKAKHHNQSVSPREKALSSPGVTIMEMRDGQISRRHEGSGDAAPRMSSIGRGSPSETPRAKAVEHPAVAKRA